MGDWKGSNSFSEKAVDGSMTGSSDHGVVLLEVIDLQVRPANKEISSRKEYGASTSKEWMSEDMFTVSIANALIAFWVKKRHDELSVRERQ
jgi:hypothetical protein